MLALYCVIKIKLNVEKSQEGEGLKSNMSLTACHKQPEMSSIPFVYSLPEVLLVAQEVEVEASERLFSGLCLFYAFPADVIDKSKC